eukprot:3871916-Rhodomonas_salina.1
MDTRKSSSIDSGDSCAQRSTAGTSLGAPSLRRQVPSGLVSRPHANTSRRIHHGKAMLRIQGNLLLGLLGRLTTRTLGKDNPVRHLRAPTQQEANRARRTGELQVVDSETTLHSPWRADDVGRRRAQHDNLRAGQSDTTEPLVGTDNTSGTRAGQRRQQDGG